MAKGNVMALSNAVATANGQSIEVSVDARNTGTNDLMLSLDFRDDENSCFSSVVNPTVQIAPGGMANITLQATVLPSPDCTQLHCSVYGQALLGPRPSQWSTLGISILVAIFDRINNQWKVTFILP